MNQFLKLVSELLPPSWKTQENPGYGRRNKCKKEADWKSKKKLRNNKAGLNIQEFWYDIIISVLFLSTQLFLSIDAFIDHFKFW